jgi:tRNA U38,U39,U40 pseudouridine synthase TruA
VITVRGPAFAYHQIRFMVGSLVSVGRGHLPESYVRDALARALPRSDDLFPSSLTEPAPAHGLSLTEVEYPAQFQE